MSRQRYLPFGGERPIAGGITQTDFGFTGQRDLAAAGLMDYNARWFNANVGAFTQPDTIVPDFGNPQSFNRYSYAYSNPINYVDPSGHFPWLIIPVFIFILTLQGDAGPYEVPAGNEIVSDISLRVAFEPYDWLRTGLDCLQGKCSALDVGLTVIPFVPGGGAIDDLAAAASNAPVNKIEEILAQADVPTNPGGAIRDEIIIETQGNADDALELFMDNVNPGSDIAHPSAEYAQDGLLGKLQDGEIGVRLFSGSGEPTINLSQVRFLNTLYRSIKIKFLTGK